MSGAYRIPAYRVALVRDGTFPYDERPHARTAADSARLVRELIIDDGNEHFGILMLDVRCRVIGTLEISSGCATSTLVHPREVFGPAVVHKAVALVLYHNHPSGDPEPSAEDEDLTRRLREAGKLLGIDVVDHVIVGSNNQRFVSLKERGRL